MPKLLRIALISASLLSITGCLTSQPAAPKVAYCPIIAVKGGSPYLYCTMPDGSKQRFPLTGLSAQPNRFICTDDAGYADGMNYQKAMDRWITNHCQ